MKQHPYVGLPAHCYWNPAMTAPAPGHINPVVNAPLIRRDQTIVSLGSCFAQRLARRIQAEGMPYLVTEPAPAELDAEQARRKGYGVYSARYGNVYTARQALQLFERAFGHFQPQETVWERGDRFVDPYRAAVDPDGFASVEALHQDREHHLACVREVFLQADWIILTLGLTEAWHARSDGAVFPLAPGVAGGRYDPALHGFMNFSARETADDLAALVRRIAVVNPGARMLLTVSPVPIAATFENRHVLVSSTLTKAALRVAADEVERQFDNVVYFPAFEIATSPAAGSHYFEDDLRHLSELGVEHVMRAFQSCFEPAPGSQDSDADFQRHAERLKQDLDVACDEDLMLESLQVFNNRWATMDRTSINAPFDEARYLQLNPDVVAAIEQGIFKTGAEHYELHGRREGRQF